MKTNGALNRRGWCGSLPAHQMANLQPLAATHKTFTLHLFRGHNPDYIPANQAAHVPQIGLRGSYHAFATAAHLSQPQCGDRSWFWSLKPARLYTRLSAWACWCVPAPSRHRQLGGCLQSAGPLLPAPAHASLVVHCRLASRKFGTRGDGRLCDTTPTATEATASASKLCRRPGRSSGMQACGQTTTRPCCIDCTCRSTCNASATSF